jgi:hypothetical protein
MAIRTASFGVITYVYSSLSDGSFNVDSLIDAVKVSATYAVLGILTPLEPFVGVGKPAEVGVPSPPAVEEDDGTLEPAPPTTLAPKP